MAETIAEVVLRSIREVIEQQGQPDAAPISLDTPLIGRDGVLDSIALVNLIIIVEQSLSDSFKRAVALANAEAFSRPRHSPFRTGRTLVEYAQALLEPERTKA